MEFFFLLIMNRDVPEGAVDQTCWENTHQDFVKQGGVIVHSHAEMIGPGVKSGFQIWGLESVVDTNKAVNFFQSWSFILEDIFFIDEYQKSIWMEYLIPSGQVDVVESHTDDAIPIFRIQNTGPWGNSSRPNLVIVSRDSTIHWISETYDKPNIWKMVVNKTWYISVAIAFLDLPDVSTGPKIVWSKFAYCLMI